MEIFELSADSGRTCLHLSAFRGNAECVDLLISSGADFRLVDTFGRLPLHYAASVLIKFQENCIEFQTLKTV